MANSRSSGATSLLGGLRWALFALAFALAPAFSAEVSNPPKTDLTEVPLEALMQMDVPKVVGASKFEQKTTEAPASVTVVSNEEIKRYGYRTLAEILESAQGFYVSYDHNYSFLGVRGMSLGDFNSRVLVLVDGHRINSSVTDGAYIETAFILDVDLIDRVEIIRGPGSVLYGNNAFFAVINVLTRQPGQLNGFEASGEYGEFDTYKARASFGKAFTNGLNVLLSGTYYHSDGVGDIFFRQFDTPAQNNGVASDKDGDWYASTFGSLGYSDFSLEGAFIHREKYNPTAQYYTTFNDSRLKTTDERGYAALKFAHSFPEIVDVSARVSYDRSYYKIGYPFSTVDSTGTVETPLAFYEETDIGDWFTAELQFNKRLWDRHILTVGAEYRDDFNLDQSTVDGHTGQPVPGGSNHQTRQSYGVYAQGDFQLRTNLHFNGGVRYDQYGDYDASVNPRLALIYQPFEKSTLKAIYGTAFRAPNFWELTYSGFQNLKPEEITGYELVYEQGIGRYLRGSLSGFYNEMDKLIVFESGTYTNFDAEAKGLEVALEGNWPGGTMTRASYTLEATHNRSSSLDLPDSPEHLVKLNLSVPVWQEKVFAGIEFQYTSSRDSLHNTTDANGQPLTVMGQTAAGFTVVNLTLFSRNLLKNLEFSASVYNLLDKQYSDPASHFHKQDLIPQNGRTFRVKLTYRF
jgi:outer membrane receptor for ferrienterochelin and colicins